MRFGVFRIPKKTFLVLMLIGVTGALFSYYFFFAQEQGDSGAILAFCGSAGKPALEECAEAFEEKTGMRVELCFGGSGMMLSQMKISETGDLYISGSPDYMCLAIQDGVVESGSIKNLAYLIPAILVRNDNPKNITCLKDLTKSEIAIGIGDPESVCVGRYAVEVLECNDLYEEVKKNIVVYAESCSKTASLIIMGKVDAIIGWRVFNMWNQETDIVYIEPDDSIPRISYIPAAISRSAKNRVGAEEFINFLVSDEGYAIFKRNGYVGTESEAMKYAPNAEILELFFHLNARTQTAISEPQIAIGGTLDQK